MKANVRSDSNMAEFEELVKPFNIPDSQPEALNWIRNIPSLRSVLDAEKNREYDRAIEKYKAEKLPETEKALRDSIYKELHPEETPEQKRIRELEEKLNAKDISEKKTMRENEIVKLSNDYGIDPRVAVAFAINAEKPEESVKSLADYIKSREDAIKNQTAQTMYAGKPPVQGSGTIKSVKDMTPDEAMQYAKLGAAQLAEVLAAQKK